MLTNYFFGYNKVSASASEFSSHGQQFKMVCLQKKAKELRKRKSEENINAEAYIAGSAEEQVSRKKSKKQRS